MKYEGFDELEEFGVTVEYIEIRDGVCRPGRGLTPETCIQRGFLPKGTKVRYLNRNGRDYQREYASKSISSEDILTVKECRIGSSSSVYIFEEFPGEEFNSVMFEERKSK